MKSNMMNNGVLDVSWMVSFRFWQQGFYVFYPSTVCKQKTRCPQLIVGNYSKCKSILPFLLALKEVFSPPDMSAAVCHIEL